MLDDVFLRVLPPLWTLRHAIGCSCFIWAVGRGGHSEGRKATKSQLAGSHCCRQLGAHLTWDTGACFTHTSALSAGGGGWGHHPQLHLWLVLGRYQSLVSKCPACPASASRPLARAHPQVDSCRDSGREEALRWAEGVMCRTTAPASARRTSSFHPPLYAHVAGTVAMNE